MAVGFSNTNKPLNPRGNDASPKGYNRAALYSGKALDFDGVNDEVLSTITISGAKTHCFWMNADGTSNERIISIFTGGYSNITFSNNKFSMYDGTNIPETTTTFETDQWYFVVAVQEANNAKIYVNGINQPLNTTNWIEHTYTGATIAIGRDASSGSYYDGEISGVRLFNTALTAAQVADLYNNPEKVVPTGVDNTALKLWLPMQEGAGTTAYDGSGNGNHGTISGATYTHGIGAPVSQTAVIDWNKGTNYQSHSEDFTTDWAKYSVTITANQTTAPDGLNTADLYDDGTSVSAHLVEKTSANLPSAVGISGFLYAKYIDTQYLVLGTYDTGYHFAVYDIQNGTLGSKMGGVTSSIEAAGNGFYKCSFTYSANTRIDPYLSFSFRDDNVANYYDGTGTNRQGYIWGASLRPTTDGDAYVRTSATAQTSPVLLPQGLTSGRDITGVNLFENVRKQGALNLDGNSWAEVHDNESLDFGTGSFSLEIWSKAKYITSGSIYNVLLTLGDNVSSGSTSSLYIDSSLNYTFRYDSTLIVAGGSSEGDWSHVVGVYDGTNINIYLNGSFVVQTAASATSKTNTYSKRIGTDTAGASRTYKDQLAQPRIYNRALTAAEVLQNYNSGKNTYK